MLGLFCYFTWWQFLRVCFVDGAPQQTKSIKSRVAQYTTPMESITAHATESDEEDQEDDDEIP